MFMEKIRPGPPEPPLDHALLVAGAAVSQASTRTALVAERMAQQRRVRFGDSLTALVQVFASHDAAAADELDGSFHPRVAGRTTGKPR